MTRPKYRDLQADRLTEAKLGEGANVRVIAGEASGGRLRGAVEGLAVAPQFLDVTLLPGTAFRETVPRGPHGVRIRRPRRPPLRAGADRSSWARSRRLRGRRHRSRDFRLARTVVSLAEPSLPSMEPCENWRNRTAFQPLGGKPRS